MSSSRPRLGHLSRFVPAQLGKRSPRAALHRAQALDAVLHRRVLLNMLFKKLPCSLSGSKISARSPCLRFERFRSIAIFSSARARASGWRESSAPLASRGTPAGGCCELNRLGDERARMAATMARIIAGLRCLAPPPLRSRPPRRLPR